MNNITRTWKEAASLIILARDVCKNTKFDYKVLVFKRHEKTSFMPNSICFPGGGIDATDEDKNWLEYFTKFAINTDTLKKDFCIDNSNKSFIFQNNDDSRLRREISLRLTAIREAFEELGIVLGAENLKTITSHSPYSNSLKECNITEWQHKVHNNHVNFLTFCESHKLLPDLWNIYEWSTWLTPTFFRKKRFETAFFIVALNEKPEVHPESEHEVAECMWESPEDLLTSYKQQKFFLPPPQLYELIRLSQMGSLDNIVNFAKQRTNKGNTVFLPIQFKTSEGFIHVLPGDDLYPKQPGYDKATHNMEEYQNRSFEELRNMSQKFHRFEQISLYEGQLLCNIPGVDGHVDLNLSWGAKN